MAVYRSKSDWRVRTARPTTKQIHILCVLTLREENQKIISLIKTQVNVPRLSYLPFLLPRLHAFFAPHLINPSTPAHQAWLSFENVPLKWHYPVGLLFDLFSGASPANDGDDGSEGDAELLPWKLVVKYSDFPEEALIPLDAEGKVLRDCFVNAVKEVRLFEDDALEERC